jgi:sugar/nucleoside kinase (ribokinase family)
MAAWQVLQQTQARHIIVTLDKRGMVVFQRPSEDRTSPEWSGRLKGEQFPSFATYALDRLGCGDALLSAATLGLAAGAPVIHAAYLGNAAAAMEVSMMGNHPIGIDRLREWLASRRELPSEEQSSERTTAPAILNPTPS